MRTLGERHGGVKGRVQRLCKKTNTKMAPWATACITKPTPPLWSALRRSGALPRLRSAAGSRCPYPYRMRLMAAWDALILSLSEGESSNLAIYWVLFDQFQF